MFLRRLRLKDTSRKDQKKIVLVFGYYQERKIETLWQLENLWKETEQENILDSLFCSWHRIVLASTN